MRSAHLIQPALPLPKVPHKHAQQLDRIAKVLDSLPQLEQTVLADLLPQGTRADFGRDGLSAQQVLRVLVLYLLLRTDFEQLEFHLADSPTYRAFCLLGLGDRPPKRSTLQENVSRIGAPTLQTLHKILVEQAVNRGIETARAIRTDTTPVAAPLRPPWDSTLLGDAVRVLERLLRRAQKLVPTRIPNHRRRVRRRTTALRNEKLDEEHRKALYFDLIQDVKTYIQAAFDCAEFLEGCQSNKAQRLGLALRTQAEGALCIVDQTERRVLEGQAIPAPDKRVSLFETHADILRKRNQVVYGHKLCLSFGKTGLVLATEIVRGNPSDSQLTQTAIEQVEQNTGKIPHDVAMDLGFASKENVAGLKGRGVQRVAFNPGRGIDAEAACGKARVRRKLYRFRAGVEGLISWLKRSLSLRQSRWKGEQGYNAYVWGVIVTASLQALAGSG